MYWMSDSVWGWRYNLPKIPGEILQGLTDNIPVCCVFYYTLVKLTCLFIHGPFKTLTKPDKENPYGGYGWSPDLWVFRCLYKHVITQFIPKKKLSSEDFRVLQYWRCPLCKLTHKRNKLRWNTGLRWER